jgi:hypothetical protein
MPEDPKEDVKEQAKIFKARIADYLKTFTTEAGKRVLNDMRKSNRYIFDPNPFTMAKNVGKQEMIKEIEDLLLMGKKPKLVEDLFRNPEDEGFQF